MKKFQLLGISLVVCLFAYSAFAQAPIKRAGASYKVDCTQPGQTIQAAINAIVNGPTGGRATIDIYGICIENVAIQYVDRVVLVGHNGATIQDASNNTNNVVTIADSTYIDLQNLTLNGGTIGVACIEMSICRMENDTVQGASSAGLHIARSNALLNSNLFLNNHIGINVQNGSVLLSSSDTVNSNDVGVTVLGANYTATPGVIQNNKGNGIRAFNNATMRLADMTITGNGNNGISLESASTVTFNDGTGTTISGNGGHGMRMLDLTNAVFSGLDTISGNTGQPDLYCAGNYWVANNIANIGGTTNCNPGAKQK
jgi:hypothetical protein